MRHVAEPDMSRLIRARQITHRNGNNRCATALCIVFTKHRRQTTRCPHGDVCIVARALIQMTHSSSCDVGGSGSLSSNLFKSLSCDRQRKRERERNRMRENEKCTIVLHNDVIEFPLFIVASSVSVLRFFLRDVVVVAASKANNVGIGALEYRVSMNVVRIERENPCKFSE